MQFRPFSHHQPDLSETGPRFFPGSLVSTVTYLVIFILGLQFAYYLIFTYSNYFDDEGTMMLLVDSFIKSGGNYDAIREYQYHGPFFFVVKYFIHFLTHTDISHNTNRLTTIAFWSLTPLIYAFYVHRLTGSLILAAIVQLQLIFILVLLTGSIGHPQELVLLLVATTLLFSSYVGSRQSSVFPFFGIAVTLGALALVKINIGAYQVAALALSMLLFLPPGKLVLALFAFASVVAVVLPAAIFGNLIFENALDRDYCAQVTLAIIACLVASRKHWQGAELRWADVGAAIVAVLCSVFLICAVVYALGGSLGGIVDTVLLGALELTAGGVYRVPSTYSNAIVAIASVLLAIGYRMLAPKLETSGRWLFALSVLKLTYGLVALYSVYSPVRLGFSFQTLSFIWIVLIPPHSPYPTILRNSFPRVFLCFSAAFQSLQAYPVAGAQLWWSVLLLAPLAAICIADAFSFLWTEFQRRRPRADPESTQRTLRWVIQVAVISCIVFWYWQKMGIGHLRTTYSTLPSLGLAGADRIHLPKKVNSGILAVVKDLKEHCDGFVGLPGMPSFYFWTGIQPPGVITDHWIFKVVRQTQNIDAMEKYENPCVLYNPARLKVWTKGTRQELTDMPLMAYINEHYTLARKVDGYQILQKKMTPPVE